MAEIHVQAKKKGVSVWLWILISIILLGAIAFILYSNDRMDPNKPATQPNKTSFIHLQKNNFA